MITLSRARVFGSSQHVTHGVILESIEMISDLAVMFGSEMQFTEHISLQKLLVW